MTTLFTNFDTALRDDAPTHRLPLVDVLDDDRLLSDLLLPDVEALLLAKSLGDDLLPRPPDTPASVECLKPDLSAQDPTDAYDLVTLDELPDDLLDLDLLAECPDDLLDLELADLLDLDLDAADLLGDEPLDLFLDDSSARLSEEPVLDPLP